MRETRQSLHRRRRESHPRNATAVGRIAIREIGSWCTTLEVCFVGGPVFPSTGPASAPPAVHAESALQSIACHPLIIPCHRWREPRQVRPSQCESESAAPDNVLNPAHLDRRALPEDGCVGLTCTPFRRRESPMQSVSTILGSASRTSSRVGGKSRVYWVGGTRDVPRYISLWPDNITERMALECILRNFCFSTCLGLRSRESRGMV